MKYHITNTNNPIDFPKVKFVHIVYVHPVELGLPNLHKVVMEQEFDTWEEAVHWVRLFNYPETDVKAVYYGCVNDETGELI